MFYFFERESEYVRCELRPAPAGPAIDVLIVEENQPDRIERYPDWASAHARWRQLQAQFKEDGWTGPLGRE